MVQSMMSSAIDRATCSLDLFIEHMLVQNELVMVFLLLQSFLLVLVVYAVHPKVST